MAEVSAAVVWDGPGVDGLSNQWRADPDVVALVQRLVMRRIEPVKSESLIEAFATAQPSADRDHRLTSDSSGGYSVVQCWGITAVP